jgi:hypothetical protein
LVSEGDSGFARFANVAGQGCAWHRPKRVMATNLENLGQLVRCNHPSRSQWAGFDNKKLCNNCVYDFLFPIRRDP